VVEIAIKPLVSVVVLLTLAPAGLLAVFPTPDNYDVDPNPQFFFTRLAYTENGYRGYGSSAPNYRCPEFGGGNFFPRQSMGWGMDYPGADCKFMGGIQRLTGLSVSPNPNVIEILDDNLFNFPYAYVAEPGGMDLTSEEASQLREYLQRGGFLHADDFWGLDEKENFEHQMKKVFPEYTMQELSLDHTVFRSFFDVEEMVQIPGQGAGCNPGSPTFEVSDDREPRILGLLDDKKRLLVVATYNSDLGDAWEYMDLPCYPAQYSGHAYRLGMNFMIYATTH